MHIVDPEGIGNDLGTATVVAGQQVAADVSGMQAIDSLRSARFEAVAEGEQAQHTRLRAALYQPGQRTPFGLPGMGLGGQAAGLQRALVKQAAIAQGQITAFHPPGDTTPGQ
ncbi:hypothetical protein D3C79_891640 [compost metagenome]